MASPNNQIQKYFWILLGFASLALGILGIFLPLLPTTPFLLLSSFCFIRSSDRLHSWLISHKVLGKYINNYLNHKAISLRDKIATLIILWVSLIISMTAAGHLHVTLLLIAVGIGVSIHILSMRTLKAEDANENTVKKRIRYK